MNDFILAYKSRIGREIGVDPDVILATSHGRRAIDVLQIYEPKLANWEC
jgi:glycerol 3-phosphatase-1